MARHFGVSTVDQSGDDTVRKVRSGKGVTIFTIGYERRNGDQLISILRDAGVEVLADVREKPMSRKPDFRGAALQRLCQQAGIRYEGWPRLGSTESQRERLQMTSDFPAFAKEFRTFAVAERGDQIARLADRASTASVALLCYERDHNECHRSVVADLMADHLDATVVAL